MKLSIPWIITKRRFIIAIAIDILINIYFYNRLYIEKFYSFPNQIVSSSVAIFWVITSYIFGRYVISRTINFTDIIRTFISSQIIFILSNFIYLFINLSKQIYMLFFNNAYNIILIEKNQTLFFIKVTFIISITSWVFEYVYSIVTYKIYQNKKCWLFCGNQDEFINFKKEVIINKKNFQFKIIGSNYYKKKIDLDNVEGVIIQNNDNNNLDQIYFFKSKGISVVNTLRWCELMLHRIPPYLIVNKYQVVEKFNLSDDSYKIRIKRLGDIFISFLLIFFTLPISFLVGLLIYLEDKGPIFYSQIRTGYKGKKIRIYKFRSMVKDAEKFGPQWSSKKDKRITKVGEIIRATRIDELPQLLSVVFGQMSLIGPRPERPELEEILLKTIPYYNYRNILKPGISGWAQVNYQYGSSIEDTINKLSYDIYYLNHISFLLDIYILFKTIKIVFTAKGNRQI